MHYDLNSLIFNDLFAQLSERARFSDESIYNGGRRQSYSAFQDKHHILSGPKKRVPRRQLRDSQQGALKTTKVKNIPKSPELNLGHDEAGVTHENNVVKAQKQVTERPPPPQSKTKAPPPPLPLEDSEEELLAKTKVIRDEYNSVVIEFRKAHKEGTVDKDEHAKTISKLKAMRRNYDLLLGKLRSLRGEDEISDEEMERRQKEARKIREERAAGKELANQFLKTKGRNVVFNDYPNEEDIFQKG